MQPEEHVMARRSPSKGTKASRGHDIANKKETGNPRVDNFKLKQFAKVEAKLKIPQNFKPTQRLSEKRMLAGVPSI